MFSLPFPPTRDKRRALDNTEKKNYCNEWTWPNSVETLSLVTGCHEIKWIGAGATLEGGGVGFLNRILFFY